MPLWKTEYASVVPILLRPTVCWVYNLIMDATCLLQPSYAGNANHAVFYCVPHKSNVPSLLAMHGHTYRPPGYFSC